MLEGGSILPGNFPGEQGNDVSGRESSPQGLHPRHILSRRIADRKQDQIRVQALNRRNNVLTHGRHGDHIQVFRR